MTARVCWAVILLVHAGFLVAATITTSSSGSVVGGSWLFTAYAVAAPIVFMAIYAIFSGRANPLWLAMGDDGHLSASKLQFLFWTVVFAYGYALLEAGRIITHGAVDAVGSFPHNVLIAMGLSVSTAVGANAITASYAASGKLNKAVAGSAPTIRLRDAVLDDSGNPDLSKVQMLFWTVVAATVYIFQAHHGIGLFEECLVDSKAAALANVPICAFPDIDTSLMILMGLGQGAYLGAKAVNTDNPRFISISPAFGPANAPPIVTISADDLGPQTGTVQINDQPLWGPSNLTWQDNQIRFTVPAAQANGAAWAPAQTLAITAITARQVKTNAVTFTMQ